MRCLTGFLVCLPLSALADTLTLPSQATEATIYLGGGRVTHEVPVTLPAGRHQILLPDLPPKLDLAAVQINAPGLQIGPVRYRADLAPPRADPERPEVVAARERVEQIRERMQAVEDAARRAELAAEADQARIDFLASLGWSRTLPEDAQSLGEIADLIARQTLEAKQGAFEARIAARRERDALTELQQELEAARDALEALVPEPVDRPLVAIDLAADSAVSAVPLRITFFTRSVSWEPTYDLHLSGGDTPAVAVHRGAHVSQTTGENWRGVQLTLSTQQVNTRNDPSVLFPDLRRIEKPSASLTRSLARESGAVTMQDMAEPAPPPGGVAPKVAAQGLALTYRFPDPVDLASGADAVRLHFDTLDFAAEIFARAVPLADDTAYVMARFQNESDEPILPSGSVRKYFDEGLVGGAGLDGIAPGEEVEMGFGPILGLQLERTVLDRAEGDRGIITRSNEQTANARIDVTNLTDRAWSVQLRDRVPYSEQEDLEITYRADPDPDIRAVDDKRGVLQWNVDLAPGDEVRVTTGYTIRWPEDMELQ